MRSSRKTQVTFSRNQNPDVYRNLIEERVIPPQDNYTGTVQDINEGEQLDNIAVKNFGTGSESYWFVIADRNVREIVGFKADFTYILNLQIPVRKEYNV